MISTNVQSFMRNFLVSLKNILKDYSIKVSYNTTILIFSFVSYNQLFNLNIDNGILLLVDCVSVEYELTHRKQRTLQESIG